MTNRMNRSGLLLIEFDCQLSSYRFSRILSFSNRRISGFLCTLGITRLRGYNFTASTVSIGFIGCICSTDAIGLFSGAECAIGVDAWSYTRI